MSSPTTLEFVRRRLASVSNDLDGLENALEPLLAQTLPETLLELEPIGQAKLQVLITYLVYDLIFVYLKTRGIDPKTHPVIAELDRVRQYFDRIKQLEDPEKRTTTVDKAAASRFIKHAISAAQIAADNNAASSGNPQHIKFNAKGRPLPSTSTANVDARSESAGVVVPPKITSKMRERAEYERRLKEEGSDEEDEDVEVLGVFDEGTGGDDPQSKENTKERKGMSRDKGKGKANAEDRSSSSEVNAKRKRPVIDPFAGYEQGRDDKPARSGNMHTSSKKKKPKKPKA